MSDCQTTIKFKQNKLELFGSHILKSINRNLVNLKLIQKHCPAGSDVCYRQALHHCKNCKKQ